MTDKKVKLNLVGLDGNAFSLLGAFQAQARKEGWTKEEIAEVREEAMSSNYDHLLQTLMAHCDMDVENEDYDEIEDDWDEDEYEEGDDE